LPPGMDGGWIACNCCFAFGMFLPQINQSSWYSHLNINSRCVCVCQLRHFGLKQPGMALRLYLQFCRIISLLIFSLITCGSGVPILVDRCTKWVSALLQLLQSSHSIMKSDDVCNPLLTQHSIFMPGHNLGLAHLGT
jgi:hypothetical protein